MLYLDQNNLLEEAKRQGLSLSALAKKAGISRQSLYDMFEKKTVFNTPFQKILNILRVDPQNITRSSFSKVKIYEEAPPSIQNVMRMLLSYCQENKADLYLFGSRARGKKGIRSDWDFAINFKIHKKPKNFSTFKEQVIESAFPYRIDLICQNDAPEWFLEAIKNEKVKLND
ncbi:MAG: nucleotidyltransferase domain-containing protein [Deltaproteobacteria bacterium]|nr:nucleotidyltransferase domain-containing protein [Deltaproteobacteria bacterium]